MAAALQLPLSAIPETHFALPKRSQRAVSDAEVVEEIAVVVEAKQPVKQSAPVVKQSAPVVKQSAPVVVLQDSAATKAEEEAVEEGGGAAVVDAKGGGAEEAAADVEAATKEEAAAAVDVEDLERTKTLRQLRDMCSARGLSSTGKKGELVQRLMAGKT